MAGCVSKHWKPGRNTVVLKPSRIRRDPVPLSGEPVNQREIEPPSQERQLWGGIAGIVMFAAALAIAIIGISAATFFKPDAAAAAAEARFGQCYNAAGPNCVIDGGTIFAGGQRVAIAGIETPAILDAKCDDERTRGIDAAVRLADLLNRGKVTAGPSFRDEAGREVRKVAVNGDDVGQAMIAAGVAREAGSGKPRGWCG
jgi:endonuclease YncB( thermonuclease family)